MNLKQFFVGRTIGFIIALILVAGFFAFNSYIYNEKQADSQSIASSAEPYRATLSGVLTCLPHKDTSGAQTEECASGLMTDAGEYYAIDFNLMSQTAPAVHNGMRFTASGVVTPIENLSSNHWQKYDVEGIFSVTDAAVTDAPASSTEPAASSTQSKPSTPANPPKESATGPCYVGGCSSQICSSEPDMASTCEYRDTYACFQTAKCERQAATGKCGWTETPELRACLAR